MYEQLYEVIDDAIRLGDLDAAGRSSYGDAYFDGNLMTLFCMALEAEDEAIRAAAARRSPYKLHMNLRDTEDIDTIGKKLLVYSDTAVVEIQEGPDVQPSVGSWGGFDPDYATEEQRAAYDAEVAEGRKASETFVGPPNLLENLAPVQLIRALVALRPLVQTGRIVVVPKHRFTYWNNGAGPSLLELDGYDAELRIQLIERLESLPVGHSIDLKLPHLRHIPAAELAAFREHHATEFEQFHRHAAEQLRELADAASVSDERRMLLAIDRIDFEIRRMDAMYRDARRKSLALSAYDLAYIAGGMVVYGVLPEGLSQTLIAVLGGAKIKAVTDRLFNELVDRKDPFYVAWKLHHTFGSNPELRRRPST